MQPRYRHGPARDQSVPWLPARYWEEREEGPQEPDEVARAQYDARPDSPLHSAEEDVSRLENQVDLSGSVGLKENKSSPANDASGETGVESGHEEPATPTRTGTKDPVVAHYKSSVHGYNHHVTTKASSFADVYFVALVAGCSAVAALGVVAAGYCFYKVQKNNKAAADVDYPAYGVTGPSKEAPSPTADRKLAQSAQMYHFQHQKQQMIAMEKNHTNRHTSASDVDTEEENEEGDYTVYECPGLAPTGEMEVKNPLFNDNQTPVSPPLPNGRGETLDSSDKKSSPKD